MTTDKELRIKMLQYSLDEAFSALPNIIDKLNAEEKGVFIEKLTKLKARYSDPEFKLAVIGNFSSGKSTFLNALIGQELLATSTLPTTAIPTYIRWNRTAAMAEEGVGDGLLDGDEPLVVIKTNGGKHYCLTSSGREALARDTGITLPDDIGSMIDTLTTSASMSSLIERLDISFPERELMRNFCLIDTPGINPGDEDCRDHIVQTQSVLREEADAAIVLYTAKDAMTRDTKSFLEENGAHLMADASIVLTKMDLAPEGEAEKLVRYTTRVLREQFSQTDPTVYCISAGRASAYLSGRSLTEQDRRWAEDFQSVINHLIDRLHSRRVEIVSRRTGEMMSELIDSVSASASAEKELMEKEKSRLENASIERLEAEFNIHKNAFLKEVSAGNDQRKQKASSIVRDAMQHTQVLLTAKIEAATSMGDLNSCLQNDYPQEMKNALQRISGRMEKEIEVPLWQSASRYQKEEEKCLRKYNQYLGALSRNEGSDQQKETSGVNLTSVDAIGGFGDNLGFFASIGVALLIPQISLLLLVVGFFVDVFRFSAKKNEAKIKLEKAIKDNEVILISECWNKIQEMESSYKSWAEKLLADYKTRYKQDFERAEQKYQNRISAVHARIGRDQEIIKSTGELKTRLENSLFFEPSDT